MKKNILIILVVITISMFLISCGKTNEDILYEPDKALKDMKGISPYIEIMEKLNKEYGTHIGFPENERFESENESWITKEYTYYRTINQSLEQFEKNALEMCEAEIFFRENGRIKDGE